MYLKSFAFLNKIEIVYLFDFNVMNILGCAA